MPVSNFEFCVFSKIDIHFVLSEQSKFGNENLCKTGFFYVVVLTITTFFCKLNIQLQGLATFHCWQLFKENCLEIKELLVVEISCNVGQNFDLNY